MKKNFFFLFSQYKAKYVDFERGHSSTFRRHRQPIHVRPRRISFCILKKKEETAHLIDSRARVQHHVEQIDELQLPIDVLDGARPTGHRLTQVEDASAQMALEKVAPVLREFGKLALVLQPAARAGGAQCLAISSKTTQSECHS